MFGEPSLLVMGIGVVRKAGAPHPALTAIENIIFAGVDHIHLPKSIKKSVLMLSLVTVISPDPYCRMIWMFDQSCNVSTREETDTIQYSLHM